MFLVLKLPSYFFGHELEMPRMIAKKIKIYTRKSCKSYVSTFPSWNESSQQKCSQHLCHGLVRHKRQDTIR